jgi:hypothetical protein
VSGLRAAARTLLGQVSGLRAAAKTELGQVPRVRAATRNGPGQAASCVERSGPERCNFNFILI